MNKLFTRFTAFLLMLALLMSILPTAFAAETETVVSSESVTEPITEPTEEETAPSTENTIPNDATTASYGITTASEEYGIMTVASSRLSNVTLLDLASPYIIIDYDAPIDEDEEQYQTYFLNKVDEQDLAALIEEGGMTVITCDCGTRCEVGSIDTSCPVCKTNMADCTGKSPEQPSEPSATEPTQPQEKPESNIGSLLTIGALALVGIGAYYYFKFGKGKKVDEDMDFYDDEGYEEEAYINEDAEPQIAEDEEAEMDGDLY